MKGLLPYIQGFTAFSGIILLAHIGTAYHLFRFGVLWLFTLAAIGSLVYGLFLIAQAIFSQQNSETEQSIAACLLYCIPAAILLVMIIFGGLTGVITGW